MNHWKDGLAKRQEKLRQRVLEVQKRVQEGSTFAFDHLLQERMDTYFILEERLEEFERLFSGIIQEIDETTELNSLQRLEGRLNYLEDSFEELDSELRGRPMRRRNRRFNFFDFFSRWQAEPESGSRLSGEIRDPVEAYRVLGVDAGSDLKTVTAAFRRLVKGLHPDTRNGDRSTEPELRRIMAAYQFIKNRLA